MSLEFLLRLFPSHDKSQQRPQTFENSDGASVFNFHYRINKLSDRTQQDSLKDGNSDYFQHLSRLGTCSAEAPQNPGPEDLESSFLIDGSAVRRAKQKIKLRS